jgi:alpha-amylase
MPSICLHFHVHQPRLLRHYTFFDIGNDHVYEDTEKNLQILNKVSDTCYLPVNKMLLDLIRQYKGDFRIAFSITGICLDQFEQHRVDVLDSFKRLADTGCVEFVSGTYYNSLAFLFSTREFKEQVTLHKKKIKTLFGQNPRAFRHTEFTYNNDLAGIIGKMGYTVILAEGTAKILGWRSPNYMYQPWGCKKLKLLFRNHQLSDDIIFRFSDSKGSEYPLMDEQCVRWFQEVNDTGDVINLFMDYETFCKNKEKEAGILEFIRLFPRAILKHSGFRFQTPSEAAGDYDPVAQLDVTDIVSSADNEGDMNAWLGNTLQKDAMNTVYGMESKVRRRKEENFLHTWRMLQASDHFTYMRTEGLADKNVRSNTNPYGSPYDAYINYMNVIDDFSRLSGTIKRS